MSDHYLAALAGLISMLAFCTVLLLLGNDAQTAIVWTGVAGGLAGSVTNRFLADVSREDRRRAGRKRPKQRKDAKSAN